MVIRGKIGCPLPFSNAAWISAFWITKIMILCIPSIITAYTENRMPISIKSDFDKTNLRMSPFFDLLITIYIIKFENNNNLVIDIKVKI